MSHKFAPESSILSWPLSRNSLDEGFIQGLWAYGSLGFSLPTLRLSCCPPLLLPASPAARLSCCPPLLLTPLCGVSPRLRRSASCSSSPRRTATSWQ